MRRIAVLAALMIMIVPLYVACGGGDGASVPTVDLSGTFGGPGILGPAGMDLILGGPQSLSSEVKRTAIQDCPTFPMFEISMTIDASGNLTDVLLCNESVSSIFGSDWTGAITWQEPNLLLYEFTTPSTGDTVFSGGLMYDDNVNNAFLFLHVNEGDLASGVVTKGVVGLPDYTTMDMDGNWSGIGFDFDDFDMDSPWRFEPINISFEAMDGGGPMTVSGTNSDDLAFTGDGGMNGPYDQNKNTDVLPNFGYYEGGFCMGIDGAPPCINIQGWQSADLSSFFGFAWDEDAPPSEWSIIGLGR